jgi:hypothetical protein
MTFQDPVRRQRQARYQALAQYEERPPWEDQQQGGTWDSGEQQAARDTGAQRFPWDSGPQQAARAGGAHRSGRNTGGLLSARTTRDTGGLVSAPDTGGLPRRTSGAFRAVPEDGQAGRGGRLRRLGLLPGALAGFLAAAVALGVANLVAAFVRPQASPIIAVGEAFIDRTPNALKEFAIQKFGENDKNMLLLGMYVTIALIAIVIGMLAWQRLWIGVAGIGLFGLFGAFVAITRPESHVTDVIPSIIGGIAGVAAIVLLIRAGMPRRAAWARGR